MIIYTAINSGYPHSSKHHIFQKRFEMHGHASFTRHQIQKIHSSHSNAFVSLNSNTVQAISSGAWVKLKHVYLSSCLCPLFLSDCDQNEKAWTSVTVASLCQTSLNFVSYFSSGFSYTGERKYSTYRTCVFNEDSVGMQKDLKWPLCVSDHFTWTHRWQVY